MHYYIVSYAIRALIEAPLSADKSCIFGSNLKKCCLLIECGP